MVEGSREASKSAAALILFLLALPFLAVGVFLARGLFFEWAGANPAPAQVLFYWTGLLVFGGFGLLFLVLALFGKPAGSDSAKRRQIGLRRKTLEDQWREQCIKHSEAATAVGRLVMATFLAVTVAPSLFLSVRSEKYGWLSLLLVPAAALFGAYRAYSRRRNYGDTFCAFRRPGSPGAEFELNVRTERNVDAQKDFLFDLKCEKRHFVRTSKRSELKSEVIWREQKPVDSRCRSAAGITISFLLPADAPLSTPPGAPEGIFWVLQVSAPAPGVDFGATFVVPVFSEA